MKVVFVHPSHPNQFTQIAYGLANRPGFSCSCLVLEAFSTQIRSSNPPIGFYGYREEPTPESSAWFIQPMEKGARCGKAVVEALAHLKASGEVDVVVGHAVFGATLFVRQLLGIPVVSYVELPGFHTLYSRPEFPAQYWQSMTHVTLQSLVWSSVLCSDLSIVPSQHASDLFPAPLRDRVRVQMEGFRPVPPVADRVLLRRELGLPEDGPLIGFAARTLEAVRGFDIFAKAARIIHRSVPRAQFVAIGDETTLYGNETIHLNGKTFRQHTWETAGMNGEPFSFRPFMNYDLFVRHLQAMDVILFPLFEGAANWGLFEAMAAGVPVVASNRCFVPEVVTDGVDGLLFDPADVAGFAAAAERVVTDPDLARRLADNARHTIATRFSVENAVTGYADIIEEAVAGFHGKPARTVLRASTRQPREIAVGRGDTFQVATGAKEF
jgi:glycosyltransferase involved in cell wall biosynthesis